MTQPTLSVSDDVADDLGDVDIDGDGNPEDDDDDEGWETEDEMEAEVDDSELTFSKHSGKCDYPPTVWVLWTSLSGGKHCVYARVCPSRLSVLRQSGPCNQLHGGDGRGGRQGLRLEAE